MAYRPLPPLQDDDPVDGAQHVARIDALTRNARGTWFALLSGLLFVGITLMGVEHIDFYGVDRATKLPLINVEVPTRLFFLAAPVLVAAIYGYFHLYLIRLWDALGDAPPLVEGQRLGDAVAPWLVTDAALQRRRTVREEDCTSLRAMERPAAWLNILLAWAFGPLILGFLWWESMTARSLLMTSIAGLALVVSLLTGGTSWTVMQRRMKKVPKSQPPSTGRLLVSVAASVLLVAAVSLLTIERTRLAFNVAAPVGEVETSIRKTLSKQWNRVTWSPSWTNAVLGLAPIDLTGQAVVEKPSNWLPYSIARAEFLADWCKRENIDCAEMDDDAREAFEEEWETRRLSAIAALKKPKLGSIDMRDANLRGVFLTGADLRGARLQSSDLRQISLESADLSGTDLTSTDLSDALLENSDLTGARGDDRTVFHSARLEGAVFRGAIMPGATFIAANMKEANLQGAGLEEAKFGNAVLQDAYLGATRLAKADFYQSDLTGAYMNNARLAGSNLNDAKLTGASLLSTDLRGALLRNSNLVGAWLNRALLINVDLEEARLEDARLREVQMQDANFRNAQLDRAILIAANVAGSDFRMAVLEGADLSRADLSKADFSNSKMKKARLIRTELAEANFRGADLDGADFSDAQMTDAIFNRANLAGANLTRANMTGASLDEANLPGADLSFATLSGTKLRWAKAHKLVLEYADLSSADLFEADLSKSNLTGAKIINADLSGAILKGSDLSQSHILASDLFETDMDNAALTAARIEGDKERVSELQFTSMKGVTLEGAALRRVDLSDLQFNEFTDLRNVYLDGTVVLTDELRAMMRNPCQWQTVPVIEDTAFYGMWRAWIERHPDAPDWDWVAPEDWIDVEPQPLPDDCQWKTDPMPGASAN